MDTRTQQTAGDNSKALATTKPATVKQWLTMPGTEKQLAMALPKQFSAERFIRVAMTQLATNPKLQECTIESVTNCLLRCAQYGIEPDGRRAHLIPFNRECTLILDYKGIAELVRRSGDVSYIHADVVRENDDFDYIFGSGAFLKHKPAIKARGDIICTYSFVKLKDGCEDFDVMSLEDINAIRNKSKAKSSGPWVDHFAEMAKKTVFRRHSKWLPLSPESKGAIEDDDEPLTEQERFEAAKPAKPIFTKPKPEGAPAEVTVDETSNAPETNAAETSTDTAAPASQSPSNQGKPSAPAEPSELKKKILEHQKTYDWTNEDCIDWLKEEGILSPRSKLTFEEIGDAQWGLALPKIEKLNQKGTK